MIELLKKLVSFDTTITREKKPDDGCVKFIKNELIESGFKSRIIEKKGFYSVIGTKGEGKPHLMFYAHHDVVPVKRSEWKSDPFELSVIENKAYGRGSVDDKGQLASILSAVKECNFDNLKGKISVCSPGDEEIGGENGFKEVLKKLIEENDLPDYIFVEDAAFMIVTRRRGIGLFVLDIQKTDVQEEDLLLYEIKEKSEGPSHSAYFNKKTDKHALIETLKIMKNLNLEFIDSNDNDYLKSNVIPKSISIIAGSKVELSSDNIKFLEKRKIKYSPNTTRYLISLVGIHEDSTFPVEWKSLFGDTINPNVIKKIENGIQISIDIRTAMNNGKMLQNSFENILKELNPDIKYSVDYFGFGASFNNQDDNLAKTIQTIGKEVGLDYEITEREGASDSRFISELKLDIPTIELGPKGGNVHGSNEYVELDSLNKLKLWNIKIIEHFLGDK